MRFKKIVFLFFFLSTSIYSQDTISIFFQFGKSTITEDQFKTLNLIPSQYDINELVSVKFIGIADSIGNTSANLKLSEKKALQIKKYCASFLDKSIPSKVIAFGERSNRDVTLNRRVDIVLYFKEGKPEPMQQPGIEPLVGCYYIDYFVLHRCIRQTIVRKKTKYILLEAAELTLEKATQDYYASQDQKGKVTIHKVKWVAKRTGRDWWKGVRYVATIPKIDFDKYKIFRIEDFPCTDCHENIIASKEVKNEADCQQVDRFLMRNMQVKARFFNPRKVSVRVPREFVDPEDQYFIGCDYTQRLYWKTEKGRRKRKYYYAVLPVHLSYVKNVVRVMKCCKSAPEPSECERGYIRCSSFGGDMDKSIFLTAETGDHFQFSEHVPYASIGLSKFTRFGQTILTLGVNNKMDLHATFKMQLRLFAFPFKLLSPTSSWQTPGLAFRYKWWMAVNIGTELKSRYNSEKPFLLDDNMHIELCALNTRWGAFISKIFVNYGMGYDLSKNYSNKFYPILQTGINLNLLKIKGLADGGSSGGLD